MVPRHSSSPHFPSHPPRFGFRLGNNQNHSTLKVDLFDRSSPYNAWSLPLIVLGIHELRWEVNSLQILRRSNLIVFSFLKDVFPVGKNHGKSMSVSCTTATAVQKSPSFPPKSFPHASFHKVRMNGMETRFVFLCINWEGSSPSIFKVLDIKDIVVGFVLFCFPLC